MKWLLGYHSEFRIRNHLFAYQNFSTMKFRKGNSLSNLLLERFRSNLLTNWIFRFPTAYEHIVFMIKVLNFKFQKKKFISNIKHGTKWTRNLIAATWSAASRFTLGRPHVQVLILAYSAVDPRLIPIVRKSVIWNWFFRDMNPLTSIRISYNSYSPILIRLP